MGATAQDKRLDVRLAADHKNLIEQAASLLGQSVSAFAISTLVAEAGRVVEESTVLRLSNRDRDAFLAALDNPPKPNARLRKGVKLHAIHVVKATR
jgi:uncharacterized protein (DUF1778 family)